jgi:peptidoglycan/xylan/chitin deacetylase (PgdA/CDA1 family)
MRYDTRANHRRRRPPGRTLLQPNSRGRGRWSTLLAWTTCLLSIVAIPVLASPAQAAPPRTAVTLTFDDGTASQYPAFQTLKAQGMKGTFYLNSSLIGADGYMTKTQLDTLATDAQEMAGHTRTHQNLLGMPADEASRQICGDRNALLGMGYKVTSFAYPFADFDTSTENIVRDCGYNSARGVGDLRSPSSCNDCPAVETRPPLDAYALRTVDEVERTWTQAMLRSAVTRAEQTGGWTTLVFHQICNGCTQSSITQANFNSFVAWLATRRTLGTEVQTVDQVVGGTLRAAVPETPAPAPGAPGVNTVQNASLETASSSSPNLPECFTGAGYGTNNAAYSRITGGHTGGYAGQVTITSLSSGDGKLVPTFDLGHCSSSVATGRNYTASVWYKSTAQVFFTLYQRDSKGIWKYWTQSPRLAPATGWTFASWTSPGAPSGAVATSFGLTLDGVGTLITDDYGLADSPAAPPPAPPGVNALTNPSLETDGASGFPQCWTGTGFGTNTPTWTRVTNASAGSYAQRLDITSWTSGDAKLVPIMDSGNCAPSVTAGHPYTLGVSYLSNAPTFLTVYTRDAAGTWSYWTQSPPFAASSSYTRATWVTPTIPSGVTAVSFGLTLSSVGSVTTDDYSLVDSSS